MFFVLYATAWPYFRSFHYNLIFVSTLVFPGRYVMILYHPVHKWQPKFGYKLCNIVGSTFKHSINKNRNKRYIVPSLRRQNVWLCCYYKRCHINANSFCQCSNKKEDLVLNVALCVFIIFTWLFRRTNFIIYIHAN